MPYTRKRLTLEEQNQIVAEMKSGVSKESILKKYCISEITYRRVINRESLAMYEVKHCEVGKKKSSKRTDNTFLDAALLEWIKQVKERGDQISGTIVKEKALMFNKQLNGPETFRASNGWIDCFKKRYNIQFKGEKVNDHFSNSAEFSRILKKKIESENLNLNNIYNAKKSEILWRLLKACTLPLYLEELKASEEKECKDHVTTLFCTNATGSHRILPLLIEQSETPQCLRLITRNSTDLRLISLKHLGVMYTCQANALMDNNIFMLWYKDEFIPRVLEHQRTSGITGKVLLLIDNDPFYSSLDKLNAINENFLVVRLPPTETSLIQPMDQGLITTTEKLYKKNLLKSLLLREKSEKPVFFQPMNQGIIIPAEKRHQISLLRQKLMKAKSVEAIKFLRELNLRDYFGMVSIAWNDMKSPTIQKAWKPLLGDLLNKAPTSSNIQNSLSNVNAVVKEFQFPTDSLCFPYEICSEVSELLSKPDYSIEESIEFLLKWFKTNHNEKDYSWESLSDSDVNSATNGKCESENVTCDFESIIKIEKSEPIFENPEPVEITSIEGYEPESISNIEKGKSFFENSGSVESISTWSCESESESILENDENEIFFKNPESVEIITMAESCEPESIIENEKSEPFFENAEPVETTSTESCEPESIIEIEKSEPFSENPKPVEITSLEAFKCIAKFKKWLQCRAECLPKHLDYIQTLENVIMEHMTEK